MNIFTFTNTENHDQHQVASDVNDTEARQLIDEGKAVEVSLGNYDEYRRQAQDAHKDFQKRREAIRKEDSPIYTDEVKNHELKKLQKEYEQTAKQLQEAWKSELADMKAQARRKEARAVTNVSQSDKQFAEQIANRMEMSIAEAGNAKKLDEAVQQAASDIDYLTDSEKAALQTHLSGLAEKIDRKADGFNARINKSTLFTSAKDTRNMDTLATKAAEQLPGSVTLEYDQMETVKNRNNKGIAQTR